MPGDDIPKDPAQILEMGCVELETEIVKTINSSVPPPNAPSTIRRKKSSKTLIDTGEMRDHVTHRIKKDGDVLRGEVGFFDEINASKAYWNEFGKGVPERSFLRSTFDRVGPGIMDDIETLIGDSVEAEWVKD